MALAEYERVACSDLYFVATGERIESHRWNPKAAALLYRFIYEIKDCSKTFSWITHFPAFPVTSKNTAPFLAKVGWYLYQVWQDYKKIENNEKYNARCHDFANGFSRYPYHIQMAILGL